VIGVSIMRSRSSVELHGFNALVKFATAHRSELS
jgi:hypothetical protein